MPAKAYWHIGAELIDDSNGTCRLFFTRAYEDELHPEIAPEAVRFPSAEEGYEAVVRINALLKQVAEIMRRGEVIASGY